MVQVGLMMVLNDLKTTTSAAVVQLHADQVRTELLSSRFGKRGAAARLTGARETGRLGEPTERQHKAVLFCVLSWEAALSHICRTSAQGSQGRIARAERKMTRLQLCREATRELGNLLGSAPDANCVSPVPLPPRPPRWQEEEEQQLWFSYLMREKGGF